MECGIFQSWNLSQAKINEFTVVPVSNDGQFCEGKQTGNGHKFGLKSPAQGYDVEADQSDTLTQNSITSLLSSKFRDVAKRWRQYGVDSPRFRKRLHSKWESMNYEIIDSQLQRKLNEEKVSKRKLAMLMLSNWLVYFAIGIGTALMAAGVQIIVELIAHQKFSLLKTYLDKCSTDKENCLYQPILIWMSINVGITLLASALVTYLQPMAAGSGIPLIKSYLNGVRIPGLLSLQAFVAKCVGVVLSILGGLACGKEGPMAHSGGIIAAGIGKGRIPWFKKYIDLYGLFRTDHNIRDLVAAGAASGVSAAFGAPVGGTLFSVEEAASFWNTELVWKVFFSAMVACFSTNFLLSAYEGHPTQLSNPGLVRFNTFPNLTFDLIEIPVFIIMAAIGGLIGSLFVVMNYKLTVFRQKYLHRKKWIKVVEASLVSGVSALAAFVLMFTIKDCTTAEPYNGHAFNTTMGCDGEGHNAMSTMFLTTPEGCLKALLHDSYDNYSVLTLVLFVTVFFFLGVWTYGLSVSSGVFIPSLTIGAAWGRLIGLGVIQLFPNQVLTSKAKDVGKYALIGAASQLGGCLRTTISLTVIIVECTGDITFGLCIMLALMISKWVGDFFTTGLYDMNVEVSGIPLLSWEPPPLCDHVYVSDFMSQPVMTFLPVEKVGHVYECLMGESFNGFPIIEQDPNCDSRYKGKLRGIILRFQILVLLSKKVFCQEGQVPSNQNSITLKDFQKTSPVAVRIEDIQLTDQEKQYVIDFRPFMNQTPYTVSLNFSMPRVFRLFRGLGLRHLVVVSDEFEPIGMVTRKDLAKYRAEIKKGMLHMEHLTVENR
ncbi:H(+)/Cl(-) exchange transporter 7-like isoform X4 [Biomphalaria glabrata]|uniref:Chloride channel protein n=1 Tax=Biomphalaria glabrata TaxID=6526 RepID=A0A9W3AV39_BIOGL|nr:H(+)/Cl(-) exchange transporter 7-like isoform X4 [Biomphalaria glabrata]